MGKHEHTWDVYTDFDDHVRARCDCGRDDFASTILAEQEQHLAQADQLMAKVQPALESSLALQQEDQQTIATMRALLERYMKLITRNRADWQDSAVLYALTDDDANMRLYQDIRAFLADHPPVVEEALEDDDDE